MRPPGPSCSRASALLAVVLGCTACASIDTTSQRWPALRPFAGVVMDAQLVGCYTGPARGFFVTAGVLDMPFSLVADVVLLPLTLGCWAFVPAPEQAKSPAEG